MNRFPILITLILITCIGIFGFFPCVMADQPVVTFAHVGEKGDFGYVDEAYHGLLRAGDDLNFTIREIEWNESVSDPDPVVDTNMNSTSDVVLMVGNSLKEYADRISKIYPEVTLVIIDTGPVPGPRVKAVSFQVYGASYLAGILAANQTQTGKIGVIAGRQSPAINRFTEGFVDGARRENPDIVMCVTYLADNDAGLTMPDKAGTVTEEMFKNGTDIIFTVAGESGLGAISAAEQLPGLFIIGVDSDQSDLAPTTVIASVVKNLDPVVYRETLQALSGSFVPGIQETGLSDGGTSLVLNPRFNNLSWIVEKWYDEAIQKENSFSASSPL